MDVLAEAIEHIRKCFEAHGVKAQGGVESIANSVIKQLKKLDKSAISSIKSCIRTAVKRATGLEPPEDRYGFLGELASRPEDAAVEKRRYVGDAFKSFAELCFEFRKCFKCRVLANTFMPYCDGFADVGAGPESTLVPVLIEVGRYDVSVALLPALVFAHNIDRHSVELVRQFNKTDVVLRAHPYIDSEVALVPSTLDQAIRLSNRTSVFVGVGFTASVGAVDYVKMAFAFEYAIDYFLETLRRSLEYLELIEYDVNENTRYIRVKDAYYKVAGMADTYFSDLYDVLVVAVPPRAKYTCNAYGPSYTGRAGQVVIQCTPQ
jgi:hypothetical protein